MVKRALDGGEDMRLSLSIDASADESVFANGVKTTAPSRVIYLAYIESRDDCNVHVTEFLLACSLSLDA